MGRGNVNLIQRNDFRMVLELIPKVQNQYQRHANVSDQNLLPVKACKGLWILTDNHQNTQNQAQYRTEREELGMILEFAEVMALANERPSESVM